MSSETKESVITSALTKAEMIALLKSDVKEWNKYVLSANLIYASLCSNRLLRLTRPRQ